MERSKTANVKEKNRKRKAREREEKKSNQLIAMTLIIGTLIMSVLFNFVSPTPTPFKIYLEYFLPLYILGVFLSVHICFFTSLSARKKQLLLFIPALLFVLSVVMPTVGQMVYMIQNI